MAPRPIALTFGPFLPSLRVGIFFGLGGIIGKVVDPFRFLQSLYEESTHSSSNSSQIYG